MIIPEPILQENKDRFVLFPIQQKELWNLYKKAENNFWYADKVSYTNDINDYRNKLTQEEKDFIRFIIAGFQLRFNLFTYKITDNFIHEVQYPEARCFYGFQSMMINIHSETYSELSGIFLGNESHKNPILTEIKESKSFKEMQKWMEDNFYNQKSFPNKVIAYLVIQRIFFSSLFIGALSFSLKNTMNVFSMISDFIWIDEGMFADFSLSVYSQLREKAFPNKANAMIMEGLKINKSFNEEFHKYFSPLGFKPEKMESFNGYIAKETLSSLSITCAIPNAMNPYRFIGWKREFISIPPYKKEEQKIDRTIAFDADF